jgi:hypothetical protein
MENAKEMNADIVSLLHIAPDQNKEFLRVTSPQLQPLGSKATDVWAKLIRKPDRFLSISTEMLFGDLLTSPPGGMRDWAEYLNQRYPWANSGNSSC